MKFSIKDFFSKCDQIHSFLVVPMTFSKQICLSEVINIVKHHRVKSVQIWSFYCSVFSFFRTEYGDLRIKSPYLVRIQEIKDQKKHLIWTLFTQCQCWQQHAQGFYSIQSILLLDMFFIETICISYHFPTI